MQARPMPSCGVRLSVTFLYPVKTNKHLQFFSLSDSHTILVFVYQKVWQYSDGNTLTGAFNAGGVGRYRDSEPISGSIAYCERLAPSAIHSAVTNRGKLMTLVAGKRRSLLMAGDDDEVYDKKPRRYAEDNVTQW